MHVIIIGAGPAGITTAGQIADSDDKVKCTVLTREIFPPYSPPLLFDYFNNGFNIFWKGFYFRNFTFCPNTPVVAVDSSEKTITTKNNKKIAYDKLVIASGASLYVPIRGLNLKNVYNFKSLADASTLINRARSSSKATAVIVGAGFIGIEISLLLSSFNTNVILVEKHDQILPSIADASIANKLQNILEQKGIRVMLKMEAKEFRGQNCANEVTFNSSETIQADFFVAATGVRPQIDFIRNSNIRTNRGICVDRFLKTSDDSIFAIGDCAEFSSNGDFNGSINHTFLNAVEQARICASNVLGSNLEFDLTFRINSIKHIPIPVIIAGSMTGDKHVYSKNNEVRIIYLKNNRIIGFQLFNNDKSAGVLSALMKSSADISLYLKHIFTPNFNHSFIY